MVDIMSDGLQPQTTNPVSRALRRSSDSSQGQCSGGSSPRLSQDQHNE
jgi:hypothetical protein